MVVHGVPTDISLELLQKELTTYNPGLVMASQPRWLTKPDQRKEKKASSVVIALSGNKAQHLAFHPRLFAFSATLRAENTYTSAPPLNVPTANSLVTTQPNAPNQLPVDGAPSPTSPGHTPAQPPPVPLTDALANTL
jgi:hypothetical protein